MKFFFIGLKKSILLGVLLLNIFPAFCQVGFDNPNPHRSSVIDMTSKDKGLLIPRMTTTDRDNMLKNGATPAHALLVFDITQNMFFVFDTIPTTDRWVALNPFQAPSNAGNIITSTTGNVGIGVPIPTEKLDVNGNIKTTGELNVAGKVTSASVKTANLSTNSLTSTDLTSTTINATTITASKFVGEGTVPPGAILMWSGSPTELPVGWLLCDGRNGTPNLSNKFILSYGRSPVSDIELGSGPPKTTGGSHFQVLRKANIPPHTHRLGITSGRGGIQNGSLAHVDNSDRIATVLFKSTSDGNEDGVGENGNNGDGKAFDNRPAYCVLAFIIKQ